MDAARPDLADVRLADRVFAPHYAACVLKTIIRAARLCVEPAGEPIADLARGDPFEVLDVVRDTAWGVAPRLGLVGYVDCTAIGEPT